MDSSTEMTFKEKIASISFVGRGKTSGATRIRDKHAREAAKENIPTSRG